MTGTVTLWVFGLLCFVVAFAKQAASGAGITLPGPETRGARIGVVLVGVLAIILGTAVRPHDSSPSAGPTPGPTSSVSGGPASNTQASSVSSVATTQPVSTSSSAGPAKLWQGSVDIPGPAGVDFLFDRNPPTADQDNVNTGVYGGWDSSANTGHLHNELSGHNLLGVWTDTGHPPTGAQCSDWASTHPEQTAPVNNGSMVCLKTDDGHTALLKIVSISHDDGSITADVTLWAPPAS